MDLLEGTISANVFGGYVSLNQCLRGHKKIAPGAIRTRDLRIRNPFQSKSKYSKFSYLYRLDLCRVTTRVTENSCNVSWVAVTK